MADEKWRKRKLILVKLAAFLGKDDDVLSYFGKLVANGYQLAVDERRLWKSSFRRVIGPKREMLKALRQYGEDSDIDEDEKEATLDYRINIHEELTVDCEKMVALLDEYLIASCGDDDEARSFYLTMKGDSRRYMAEFSAGEKLEKLLDMAEDAYAGSTHFAKSLPPTHPVRLCVAVNYSVFTSEFKNERAEALKIAQTALDEALAGKNSSAEFECSKFSSEIQSSIETLRANIADWTIECCNNNCDEIRKEGAKSG